MLLKLFSMSFLAILATALLLSILGIFAWFDKLKRNRDICKKELKLESMLSGRALETVLAKSPYKYLYLFQGDSIYRIYDNRNESDNQKLPVFIDFVTSKLDAHLWIVDRYSSEQSEDIKIKK